jgi:hypothetical protein
VLITERIFANKENKDEKNAQETCVIQVDYVVIVIVVIIIITSSQIVMLCELLSTELNQT